MKCKLFLWIGRFLTECHLKNNAQHGSLNHNRLKFPVQNSYCINLDIDEYLVKLVDEDLLDYLTRKLSKPNLGAVSFQEYLVPTIVEPIRRENFRFLNFEYRYKEIGHTGSAKAWSPFGRMKYIFKYNHVGYNATHRTRSDKNRNFWKKYDLIIRVKFLAKKCVNEIARRIFNKKSLKPRIDTVYASEKELFFLHFLGLNTGWRNKSTTATVEFDSEIHVEEPMIAKLAKKANLGIQ